ncbi:hypothetical protein DFR46_0327 [Parasphingopyxis lamellibrachiae]|uniref:Uncharacterized protein n=1 Tax=Parasphingopyxis lamellibrachiae TaxID=680125 RepID=A0A3D9FBZ6_9SPHN|nr:hypothetical protein DFR46_0327 [Parasphingopyxis lamellibrachiae]
MTSFCQNSCPIGLAPPIWRQKGETIPKQPDKRGGVRLVLTIVGGLLVIAAPIVGLLPGPGGIFVFAVGFALMLKNSALVRKFYARLKSRHPKKGEWVDWAMRRKSALRRSRRKREEQGTD